MVLPPSLVDEVAKAKGGIDTCGVLDQLTLAEFITSGAYDRHVRSARLRYRRRRDTLVDALAQHAPDVHVTGIAAGFHAVLSLPPGTEQSVVQAAAWQGLALHTLSFYRHEHALAAPWRPWSWATAPHRTTRGRERWRRCAGCCREGAAPFIGEGRLARAGRCPSARSPFQLRPAQLSPSGV